MYMSTENKYAKLFEPMKIGKLTIKNRISMAPLGLVSMCGPQGEFTKRAQDYYVERARGGTGLIITGVTTVDYNEMAPLGQPCPTHDPHAFSLAASLMNERIHSYDAKIFLQLSGGFGRAAMPHLMQNAIAPSRISNRWDPNIIQEEMTVEQIHTLIDSFVKSAVIAKKSGFDGVEIHAVHEGYLLDQFAISFYNHRTDEYGGNLKNRLRLACEVVQGIKKACGEDFPVSLRYSLKSFVKDYRQGAVPGEEFEEKGKDIDEGIEGAKILVAAGYDSLNVDVGTYDSWYWNHPPMYFKKGMYRPFGEILKKEVDVPIILAGRMDNPHIAVDAIGKSCDMISLGRPLLADPYWPNKVRTENIKDIRPCLSCHQGCIGRFFYGLPLSCAVNPACGREEDYALKPVHEKKRLLIIGGGLAGMETARVAAIRGHEVELWEKSDKLGGVVIPGGMPDFKEDDHALIRWYEHQLSKLPITIRMNKTATIEDIKAHEADIIVIATGANPINLNFADNGSEAAKSKTLCQAVDVLNGEVIPGQKVAIIGAGLVGCELALWLNKKNLDVTIVESTPDICGGGKDMCFANYDMLRDLLKFNKIRVMTNTKASQITFEGLLVKCTDDKGIEKEENLSVDTIVTAVGYKSENKLYKELQNEPRLVYQVGDARNVHNIMAAIWDAYELGRSL